jgi:hypothetical protein
VVRKIYFEPYTQQTTREEDKVMRKRYWIGMMAIAVLIGVYSYSYAVISALKITSFNINNGDGNTTSRGVILNNTVEGSASEYRASESQTFVSAYWKPYSSAPKLTLSVGNGTKTVYFQVRDKLKRVSNIARDTILFNISTTPTQGVSSGQSSSGASSTGKTDRREMEPMKPAN